MKIHTGNIIQDMEGNWIIASLTDLVKEFQAQTLKETVFAPVRITEEILSKLNAEKRIINNLFPEYSIECTPKNYKQEYCFRFWFGSLRNSNKRYPDDIKWTPYGSGTMHSFQILFLHEFQNAYSVISGEDLDISGLFN